MQLRSSGAASLAKWLASPIDDLQSSGDWLRAAATDDRALKQGLQTLTNTLLDEAFIAVIAEGNGQLSGPEVARASVANITWDRFGTFAYQDIWLA
jgi:hypothetical protein